MDTSTDALDRRDMARLMAGEDRALDDLMDRHGQQLFRFLVRLLRHEHDAADVAQDTFVRVYERKHQFRPDGVFGSWLFRIALNLGRDRLRRVGRRAEVSLEVEPLDGGSALLDRVETETVSPREVLEGEERSAVVRAAVRALPEELRLPLMLSEYEAFTHPQIAEILGCSAKAVEMRVYRARKSLRSSLSALEML